MRTPSYGVHMRDRHRDSPTVNRTKSVPNRHVGLSLSSKGRQLQQSASQNSHPNSFSTPIGRRRGDRYSGEALRRHGHWQEHREEHRAKDMRLRHAHEMREAEPSAG